MKKMQIVIDGRMILPEMSGIGRYLIGLCHGLNQIESGDSYELLLQRQLPADHAARSLKSEWIKIRNLSSRHMSLSGQFEIPRLLRAEKPDIFHYPHFDLPIAGTGRIVATIHDLKYIANPNFFPNLRKFKRLAMHQMMEYTCWRSRLVICVSQFTKNDLHNRLGVPHDKLRVVSHGVDEKFFSQISASELKAFRERKELDKPYLLFVGDRRPHKNLPGLINTFRLFEGQASQDYELVIAGRRYADYRVPERMTLEMGLLEQVHFIDHLSDSDLPLLYRAADALVLTSFYEGFGLPVLEAMACGTPVVASRCTAIPEVSGEAAILVSLDDPQKIVDALLEVIPGGSERERCILEGMERARSYTWEQCARRTNDVYHEALSS